MSETGRKQKKGLLTPPTDAELLGIPGVLPNPRRGDRRITGRTVLHEWPLSRVELAELAELEEPAESAESAESAERAERPIPARRAVVVKSQLRVSSVETAFYRFIRERTADGADGVLLPGAIRLRLPRFLGASCSADRETDWLVLSYEEGEPESWDGMSEGQIRSRVRELSRAFQSFAPVSGAGDVPVFTDWSTHGQFAADMDRIFPALLCGENGTGLDRTAEAGLRGWIEGPAKDCWDSPVGLLHGDLKADNLIRITGGRTTGGETVVLDWQRPMKAPLPLEEELSLLLENRSPDPSPSAAAARTPFRRLACLALCRWYAWAFLTCLPHPFVRSMAVRYAGMGI